MPPMGPLQGQEEPLPTTKQRVGRPGRWGSQGWEPPSLQPFLSSNCWREQVEVFSTYPISDSTQPPLGEKGPGKEVQDPRVGARKLAAKSGPRTPGHRTAPDTRSGRKKQLIWVACRKREAEVGKTGFMGRVQSPISEEREPVPALPAPGSRVAPRGGFRGLESGSWQ